MARRGRLPWILLATAGIAACAAPGQLPPPKRVVLVTIDTWRSDALGASGSGLVATPNLDALAREGTYCPKAWSSSTLTAPSHATILTGSEPYVHGVRANHGFRLAPGVTTLAETLRANGYATAAFVSAHPLARISGLDRGFDIYDDALPPGNPLQVTPRSRPGAATIDAAARFVHGAPERFFLWVHVYEPHDPYAAPEPHRSRYGEQSYYGEVAYADELVGRLRATLGAAGDKDTLFVVCGDHGEALGDHGERTHGIFVYDATARVPLLLWAPGRLAAQRVEFARLTDVTPTVLALCGVSVPAGLDGRSLVASQSQPAAAYIETLYPYLDFAAAPVRALSDGRTKVIDVPELEAYDLSRDPGETHNLAGGDPPPEIARLLADLRALPGAEEARAGTTDPEQAAALRSLGYIGAGGEYTLGAKGMDPKAFVALYRDLDEVHALCEARRFEEALPIYARLLAAFPRSSVLCSEAGLVEMTTGRVAEAQAHLRRAQALDPGNSHALLGLANLALAGGDGLAAERYLLAMLELDPDDVEANFNLGTLYYQTLGQPGKAVPYWQRFLTLQPGDPEAPRLRALLANAKPS